MNRNNATHYLALIFYFSCLQTGVFGLSADPVFARSDAPDKGIAVSVFEQPLSSLDAKTVLNIPDIKVSEVSLFGTKENPVAETKPLSQRTFAWFWDSWFKDDDTEEMQKPEVDASSGKKTTSEIPKKEIIEKKGDVAEELPWWKPEAYEIIEEGTPPEVVPEKKIMAVPEVAPVEKPVVKAKPEMKMKETVPETPPVVKQEAVEIPEPTIAPEVVPEVSPVEKPVVKAKPEMEMKETVLETPPVMKQETVEIPEPTIAPEVVPEKKIMAVPEVAPVEKPVVKAKPEMEMKETVPETPPVVKQEAIETPEPTIAPEVVPEKKIMAVPEVAPIEKPVVKAKPEMKMKETVPETPPVVKQEAIETPEPTIAPEVKVTSTGFFKGAKVCEECHEGEYKIWKKTKHHTSFRTVHREPKDSAKPSPKKILKNVAGAKRMKRNKTCYLCHYTLEKKDADAKPVAKSGTSCESCHGASSEYLAIHDNYGGEGVKRVDETPQHKKERIEKSTAKGLIWPVMKYQVVENCMTCHGLAHPDLSGDVLAKMLGAGHPINPDFEAVKYSQGTVRHRYTPEDINNNREMTEQEKAELFVIGHAAALVSAKEAISKSSEPKYVDAQNKRAKNAEAVLSLLTDIPEAAQLMAEPNRANALKLVNTLAGKDLTGKVGSMLPKKSDYK